mmetsp:Transcript_11402/g.52964  ORF Transcript_11402/g.52964 Transcript_11402/m.52964 type:complete len:208 (+) Transcript_11402:3458-4081(+)
MTGRICLAPAGSAGAAAPPREDAAATAAAAAICGSSTVHASLSAPHTGFSSSAKDWIARPIARLARSRSASTSGPTRAGGMTASCAAPAAAIAFPAASVSSRRATSRSNLSSAATTCDTRSTADPEDATDGGSLAAAAAAAADAASAVPVAIVCAAWPAAAVYRTDSRLATASPSLDRTCWESAEASSPRKAGATLATARHTSAVLA